MQVAEFCGGTVLDELKHPDKGGTVGKAGLFVVGLMSFVGNWNELLLAMVFISDDTKKTLPVSLSKFVGPYHTNYTRMFAAIMIAIIPTIIVYCGFSNQIVDGLTQGAVKGRSGTVCRKRRYFVKITKTSERGLLFFG